MMEPETPKNENFEAGAAKRGGSAALVEPVSHKKLKLE